MDTNEEQYQRANPMVTQEMGEVRTSLGVFLGIVAAVIVVMLVMAWHDKRAAQQEQSERSAEVACALMGGTHWECADQPRD